MQIQMQIQIQIQMYNIEDVQKKKSVTLTGVVGPDPVKGESDKLPKPWLSSKI